MAFVLLDDGGKSEEWIGLAVDVRIDERKPLRLAWVDCEHGCIESFYPDCHEDPSIATRAVVM